MSDQTISEVIDLLYGGGGDDLIRKMNPTQSDVSSPGEQRKRKITAGLSAVGATAGALGLGYAAHELHGGYKAAKVAGKLKPFRAAVKAKPFASALFPAEVAGLGGEVMSTKILHGDTQNQPQVTAPKKPGSLVQKDINLNDMLNQATDVPRTKGQLTRAVITSPKARKRGIEYTRKTGGMLRKLPDKVTTTNEVDKRDDTDIDVTWDCQIAKADKDKQQVFGWASVIEVNGEPVLDLQGDVISADEMEKAGYEYVVKSRKGGDMHLRDGWEPIQKSDMIESFIVTDEKRQAMGLPDSVPTGWWVGFQIHDPAHWDDIKSGKRTGFSIHGHGRRSPLTPERS